MIRVIISTSSEQSIRICVEGQIVKATAGKFRVTCAKHIKPGRLVELSLAGVSSVDRSGLTCLRDLRAQGAELTDCSEFLEDLLRQQIISPAGQSSATDIESNLILRLRQDDANAFEDMVRTYGGRMLATAKRYLRSDVDAQDATQDAFLAAYRAIDRFAGDSKLSTWLHRVVVNTSLMHLRRKRRRPEDSISDLLPRFEETGKWADTMTLLPGASEALLESKQIRATVRACIERLPTPYRAVLLARDIEQRDIGEVAQLLGINLNAAKQRLHRARQALKALLERERRFASDLRRPVSTSSQTKVG